MAKRRAKKAAEEAEFEAKLRQDEEDFRRKKEEQKEMILKQG
jgi:hypothetical protein